MFLMRMNGNYATERLPLHVPHKDGMALRHLLKFDHAGASTDSVHEHNFVILAVFASMLVTALMTVACIFVVWRWHKRLQGANMRCERCVQVGSADVASVVAINDGAPEIKHDPQQLQHST